MKKKNIVVYLTLCLCFACGISFSQNVNLSTSKYWDGECYLAANPKNPKHLVTAWMYFSLTNLQNAIATRTSFDGGKTWSPLQLLPHVYPKFTCADPTMYFGKDSCVYLAYIDLSGLKTSDSGYIMVTRSVNGGINWKPPVKAIAWNAVANLPIDRPWIAADGTNGPYAGRVYLTSQNAYFTPQPHHPWFTYSTDSGSTWTPIKQLDDSIPAGVITDATAFTTVAANGTLYGIYFSYYTLYSPYPRLILVKSYNGGATFTTHAAINYTAADVIPTSDSLLKDGICLSSNPTDTNNLILIGPSNAFGEPDIVTYNTFDVGTTWNGPTRVNDDIKGAYDTCHDLVWGSFAPNGTYGAAWRDRRNTGKGDSASFEIYAATSVNGGSSFTPNFLISDSVSPPVLIEHGDDFLGCALTDSALYVSWSDLRTGKENTFFNATPYSKIPASVLSVSDNSYVKVEVCPNPFHNETNVVITSSLPLKQCLLSAFTADGKKVLEMPIAGVGTYKVNFSSFLPGTYIWSLTEDGRKVANGKWVNQ